MNFSRMVIPQKGHLSPLLTCRYSDAPTTGTTFQQTMVTGTCMQGATTPWEGTSLNHIRGYHQFQVISVRAYLFLAHPLESPNEKHSTSPNTVKLNI